MQQHTILVVEDDAILALHLQTTLGDLGYKVLQPVSTGERAIEAVAAHRPDLVLMDIELSGEINGIRATEAIRKTNDVPIVYLTGFSQNRLLEEAKATGPYGYLVKPVPERELSATIEIALYRHELDGKLRQSEDRFRRLAENASDLIYRYELVPARKFSYVSPAAERITGYTPEEHYTDPDLGFKLIHPDDRSLLEGTARGDIVPGQSVVLRWIRKDGTIVWTEQRNTPILDSFGNIIALEGIARDITDRKRAEELLSESSRKIRSVLETVSLIGVMLDQDGNITLCNDYLLNLTGWRREEVMNKNWFDTFVPEDIRPEIKDGVFAKSIRTGDIPRHYENDIVTKNGHRRAVNWSNTIIYDQSGVPEGVASIGEDITDRKRAEEQIRMLAELTDISPATITVHDYEGHFLYANQRTFDLHGYSKEEFLSLNLRSLDVPTSAELIKTRMEKIRDKGQASFEVDHYRKDGSILPLEVFVKRMNWLGKDVLLSVGTDISERRQVIQQLRESNEMFSTAFQSGPAMMTISDIDTGAYLKVNQRFVQLSGFSEDEVIGKSSLELGWITTEDRQRLITAVTDKGSAHGLEIRLRTKKGSDLWCSISAEPIVINGVKRLLTFAEDLTERRQAEELLRQAQKLESIGTLAGGIAHDFNNLLNAILGQSSLAMGKTEPESPARNHIAKAVKATERAAELTRQLLAYSGKGRFFLEDLDLNSLVRENVQMLELSIPKTIVLQYELAPAAATVRADKAQMQQIIMNLLINAGEAIGSAEGTIVIRTKRIRLSMNSSDFTKYTNNALPPDDYVALEISDTGCGISKESLDRLFDPFYTTKFTGRGLGLAAVLGIVRGHKGGIRIATEVGKGTQFEIVLPALRTPATEDVIQLADDFSATGASRTILVIDDQPHVLELVTDILTDSKFNVLGSLSRYEGIDLYRRKWNNIALVILDYSMPGMDGKAAFAELLRINGEAKVLVCSGYSEEAIAASFDDVPPAGFIQKPYKPATLLDKVLRLLGER